MAHFILNDHEQRVEEVSPGTLVLDYLRRHHRLIGTKEGCKEGDCGACTVLIGELRQDRVEYKPVTSCLMPVGELHGKHLVTIEGLNLDELTPVQQAIVDNGGTQCGFCTPGIVVSMTALLMNDHASIDRTAVKKALSGHLCRCTGYRSLKACQDHLSRALPQTGIEMLIANQALPDYFRDIPERLKKIHSAAQPFESNGFDCIVAGGTDIYVQQGEELPEKKVHVLNLHPELGEITRQGDRLRVGALTTFEDFACHPVVQEMIPHIGEYMHLIASWQIRNRATLGGNIINASPIGDMTILFLALKADLILRRQNETRATPMIEFYRGYKQLNKASDELLTQIVIPAKPESKIDFEKVSKRKCLDIATVNSAIALQVDGGIITDAGLAVGGVAPVPLFMKETCKFLTGREVSFDTVQQALARVQAEISPISDVRGSADYKRLLARQLLIAHFTKLFPESINIRSFYETH